MKKFKIFISITSLSFFIIGCMSLSPTAPPIPDNLYKPSPTRINNINGINISLPDGWKNVPDIPKNYKESGGIIYLEHKEFGNIIIYKKPFIADERYGKLFLSTMIPSVMPDAQSSREMALKKGGILQIHKGTISVEGERFDYIIYTAYNIDQGAYYMHSGIIDKPENKKLLNDFIAIADSIN